LDRENPAAVVFERLQRARVQDGDGLTIWGGWLFTEPPSPDTAEGGSLLRRWVRSCKKSPLIIVDSLVAFQPGNENDAQAVRAHFGAWRKLAHLGAAVVILHHVGKAVTARRYRGSSDVLASVDSAFLLANSPSGGRLNRLTLTVFKSRHGLTGKWVYHYVNGRFIEEHGPKAQPPAQILTALLREHPGVGAAEFEELSIKLGPGRSAARDFIKAGEKAGSIKVVRGDHNSRSYNLARRPVGIAPGGAR
jgi:hypothetical protein